MAVFDFTSDTNNNSLNDNKLKSEIRDIRTAISKSGYRTRFAVMLLSDESISEATDTDDRLSNIRRGAGLDPKHGLFVLPPNSSRIEVTTFVKSFINAVQPSCLEYYRDLTKHTRRKRNRGSVPSPTMAPTTSSQPLSTLGWGIRYDVKQGIFAEFRQEMDAACRHYTSALEGLMGSEGIFETMASWSPRWNECRILADMMAFRIIRCLLWSEMGTTAAQSWINYRDRMRELVDRRGKGSTNYGWEAWESRWAKVMAQLIQRASIEAITMTDPVDSMDLSKEELEKQKQKLVIKSGNTTFMKPESVIQSVNSIPPWHHLHQPAYWLRISARHSKRRRKYASDIPDDDRIPPAQTTASAVTKRSSNYDSYLAPEPHEEHPMPPLEGFDHSADIIDRLARASQSFKTRDQLRFSERIDLETGRELLRKGAFQEGVQLLKPLWHSCSWRRERWWMPLFELIRTLGECAKGANDVGVLAGTTFELYSPHLRLFKDMKFDLMTCGKELKQQEGEEKPSTQLSAESIMSFSKIVPTFVMYILIMIVHSSLVFHSEQSHVGETTRAQLRVFSSAHPNTAPIVFTKIIASFNPDRLHFELCHDPALPPQDSAKHITLVDLLREKLSTSTTANGITTFTARANLTFQPGQNTVYILGLDVRDPGAISVASLKFNIETEYYSLLYTLDPPNFAKPNAWVLSEKSDSTREKRIGREAPWKVDILPKPPKLEVEIKDISRAIYTDEVISLEYVIRNAEDEQIAATIDTRLLSKEKPPPEISWLSHNDDDAASTTNKPDGSDPARSHTLPPLEPGADCIRTAKFTAPSSATDLVLEAKIHYFLTSDPEVPLSKIFTATLNVGCVFEASYEFSPRIHTDPWPSFFNVDSPVPGLVQRWNLVASLASFATTSIRVRHVFLEIIKAPKGLHHGVQKLGDQEEYEIAPRMMHDHSFTINTTRPPVKEHRQMTIQAVLKVTWARTETSEDVISSLPVSPMTLPPLEPRIVASAKHGTFPASSSPETASPSTAPPSSPITSLTLTMENPSQHPLTFDITTPSSESLAFSGPKQQAVTLLPYSRVDVGYRLLPLLRGGHWVTFGVKVSDRYFARDVPVLAGEGVLMADDGAGLKWWMD